MPSTRWHERFFGSTRGKVLGLLRRENRTVEDLAAALDLTDNAVRAHLVVLERDGLVRQSGARRGAGKPAYIYELTPEAERLFPKAHGVVLRGLLESLDRRLRPEELDALMREVGRHLAESWRPKGKDLEARLRETLRVIEELGGVADLERVDGRKGEESFMIRGFSCPLAAVTPEHPEVCRLLAALVAELAVARVQECCDRGPRPACCFEVTAAARDDTAPARDQNS